jgi:hypothetical protein
MFCLPLQDDLKRQNNNFFEHVHWRCCNREHYKACLLTKRGENYIYKAETKKIETIIKKWSCRLPCWPCCNPTLVLRMILCFISRVLKWALPILHAYNGHIKNYIYIYIYIFHTVFWAIYSTSWSIYPRL